MITVVIKDCRGNRKVTKVFTEFISDEEAIAKTKAICHDRCTSDIVEIIRDIDDPHNFQRS